MQAHRLLLLVVAVSYSFAAERSRACDCITPGVALVEPADGAEDVPRNTRVWLGDLALRARQVVTVVDDASNGVRGAITQIESAQGTVTIFTPDEPLAPSTRHDVLVDDEVVAAFTTGTSFDDELPPPPAVVGTGARSDPPFTIWCGGVAPPDYAWDVSFTADGVLHVVDRVDDGSMDATAPAGTVDVATTRTIVDVGAGRCATGWPQAGPFAAATFRLGTFDVAGNFSGFGDPRLVVLPPPGCSCAAAHGASSSVASAAGVAAILARALRRTRRC